MLDTSVKANVRTCRSCNRELPLGDFYRDPQGHQGRKRTCKRCILVRAKRALAKKAELRTERAIGGMLASSGPKQGGDRKSRLHDATLKLADLGIEKTESHRWQRLALIPDPLETARQIDLALAKT